MPFVIFAAPLLSVNASRMIESVAALPDVQVGVISYDWLESAPDSIRERVVGHWRVDDVLDPEQLTHAARELSRRFGPIHRIFGAYEQLQVPLAQVRERLGVEGMRSGAAQNFRDKARMKSLLRAAGIPCARHRLADGPETAWRFAEEVGYPLVAKPPAGAGAAATVHVDGPEALRSALAASDPAPGRELLLEEFITGDEFSMETLSVSGGAAWQSVCHYLPTPLEALRNPWIQWCVLLPREQEDPRLDDVREASARALQVLGMDTGLSHMEWFRRRDGSIAISEVAARPPGAQITTLLSRAHDVDFVGVWARLMVFGDFEVPPRRYAAGVAFLRGQGRGRVRAVHGLDAVQRELGELVTDARIPQPGQPAAVEVSEVSAYEGEGWILLRHPDTAVVREALQHIVSTVRVELG